MEDTGGEYFFVEMVLNGAKRRARFPLKPTVTVDFVEKKLRSTHNVIGGTLSSNSHDTDIVDELVAGGVYFFVEFIPLSVQRKFIHYHSVICFYLYPPLPL